MKPQFGLRDMVYVLLIVAAYFAGWRNERDDREAEVTRRVDRQVADLRDAFVENAEEVENHRRFLRDHMQYKYDENMNNGYLKGIYRTDVKVIRRAVGTEGDSAAATTAD